MQKVLKDFGYKMPKQKRQEMAVVDELYLGQWGQSLDLSIFD